jgi:hypothetical protein
MWISFFLNPWRTSYVRITLKKPFFCVKIIATWAGGMAQVVECKPQSSNSSTTKKHLFIEFRKI